MGFWKKDEQAEFKAANPGLTKGMSDKQVEELMDDERAEQENMLGHDTTEDG